MDIVQAVDILNAARNTYLNDPLASQFTDAKLLPLLQTAHGFLETDLQENGLLCVSSEYSPPNPILAGQTQFDLPPDFVVPVKLQERQAGTSDEWRDMAFRWTIPQITPGPFLEYWTWQGDVIILLAADSDREVKLHYRKSFPVPETNDAAVYSKAAQYLAAKVAALAYMFLVQSPSLAQPCDDAAEANKKQVINIAVKTMQAHPQRRKAYIPLRSR